MTLLWERILPAVDDRGGRRMIHTAVTAVLAPIILTTLGAGVGAQDKPVVATQASEIQKVIDSLKALEKGLKSVTMDISTRSSYPSEIEFTTSGSLRVLGTTHSHIRVVSSFGDNAGMRTLLETVITPDGVSTHQDGPVESDVYTHMDKDLMNRLKEATRALAADKDTAMRNPGPFADGGKAPLGSGMLEALNLQFELKFEEKTQKVDDTECRVIRGRWRGSKAMPPAELDLPRAVDLVEVFISKTHGIPIRVVQYNKRQPAELTEQQADKLKKSGQPPPENHEIALEVKITNLNLDPKLEPKDFRLEIPEGVTPLPVMGHRPSRAQINRILQEYAALQQDKKDKPGKTP